MSWRRILPLLLTVSAVLCASVGCESGTLIDEEMWRINLILEDARGKTFEKRMQETFEKSKKLRVKLLRVREKAQTWAEEIDSLETKISFMEKSREPLRQKAEKWEADGEKFLMKAVELKSKTEEARGQMIAAQGKLEQ
ncbi:MAG: hypothetical protein ACYS47_02210, partial [Planctomycetota bacterium]